MKHVCGAVEEGMLVCKLTPSEVKDYLALLLQQLELVLISSFNIIHYIFCIISDMDDDNEPTQSVQVMSRKYKPVICSGRQPNSNIFVVGPLCHFENDGTVVAEKDQDFIWIPYVIRKLRKDGVMTPFPTLPTLSEPPLQFLVKGMKSITGDNLISALFMLG